MTESAHTASRARSAAGEGFLLALLCLGGFLGNRFGLHVVNNVEIQFGSFFVMLAVARFGFLGATAAGVATASATLLCWGHPWALVVFSLEALFVALCQRRRCGNLVLADTLYWIVAGMPLVFLLYGWVLGFPFPTTLLIALKQSANGLLNALLATVLLYATLLVRKRAEPQSSVPLREIIFTALVAVTVLPAMAGLVHDVIENVQDEEAAVNSQVTSVAQNAEKLLSTLLADNLQSVAALARRAGSAAPGPALQHQTETLQLGTPKLLLMAVFDRNSVAVAHAPATIKKEDPLLALSSAQRTPLVEMERTLRPVVGDAAASRSAARGAVVPLLAPIVADGRYRGYCSGLINLGTLGEQLGILVDQSGTDVTVIDRTGKVVVSTGSRFRSMDRFLRPTGERSTSSPQATYHKKLRVAGTADILRRGSDPVMFKELSLSPQGHWNVVVERRLAPVLDEITEQINDRLIFLWGTIILILPLSRLLSGRLADGLNRLEITTAAIPRSLGEGVGEWPSSNIRELQSLSSNVHLVADALSDAFREVTALNHTLEQRIEERTRELRESRDRLQSLALQVPGAIFQYQLYPDGRATFPYLSQVVEEIYELTPEDIAEDPSRILKLIHPDDLPGYLASVDDSRSTGKPWQHEFRVILPVQGVRWRLGHARPQPLADGSVLWHGIVTDISQRKFMEQELADSEHRFRSIIEATPNLIMILEKGRFIFLNPAATAKLGAGSAADLLGTEVLELIHPDDRELCWQRLKTVQEERVTVAPREIRLLRPDGEQLTVEVTSMPISQKGRWCVLSVAVDVTARKRAEELLYQQTALLEEEVHERQLAENALARKQLQLAVLNRSLEQRVADEVARSREKDQILIAQSRQAAMGEMVGNIAHQWRQPLNALGLLLANIEDSFHYGDLDQAGLTATVEEGNRLIQKMSATINDFRNFFRPDREVVAFSAAEQVQETIALVETSFGNDHISLTMEVRDELTLSGFPNQFSQVLLNLLTNAKEAIRNQGAGAGAIVISLEKERRKGCIAVRDSGGGIPQEIMPRIFEPYFSTKQGGTGVGLYMSKMIIERNMHGTLEARNIVGGAEFLVCAPLAGEGQ